MITIQSLTPLQLGQFIRLEEYLHMPVVPISRHRAESHIANPRVADCDVILLLAYDEKRLVGYLGILADNIHFGNEVFKAGWLSCMWVDPLTRGQGIAKMLLQHAFDHWNNQILVTEFTVAAKGLYNRSANFTDLKIAEGLRCYLRFNLNYLLPQKNTFLSKIKGLLLLADGILNSINYMRLLFYSKSIVFDEIRIEKMDEVDAESWHFIKPFIADQFIRRNREDLNWVLQNPWLKTGNDENNYKNRYHFSAIEKRFEFRNFKFINEQGKIVAVMIFSIRNQNLKIPYAYIEKEYTSLVGKFTAHFMLTEKLDMLTTFHAGLVEYLRSGKTPFYHKRKMKRHYIITKKFLPQITDRKIILQDGDADCAFT